MVRVRNQRKVIDRKALWQRLEELLGWSGYSPKMRPEVLAILKQAYADGCAEVRWRLEERGDSGAQVVASQALLVDQLVRVIYDLAHNYVYPIANPTTGEQLSLVATGGYGRGELAPFSDIDLMFLLPYKQTPHGEQIAEYMLYMLWDLGLKVGHATRSVDEAVRLANADITIRTSMLEARWIWGDQNLFRKFKRRFAKGVLEGQGAAYVEEKLAERDQRHARMGDTRYVLEPNIKEGKGGLRDLQTLFWIVEHLYQVRDVGQLVERGVLTKRDARRFDKAHDFLWTVRCHLHYLAGRPEERLTFDVQKPMAERLGYADRASGAGVERFMKHYFLVAKEVGDLTRILCAVLEEQHAKKTRRIRLPAFLRSGRSVGGFAIDGDRLTVESADTFKRDPVALIRLFHAAQKHKLDIHPNALRWVTQNLGLIDQDLRNNAEANRLFMEMMTSDIDPEKTLIRLNEAGVFGRFIPDFGRIVAQMQYDMYHVYTVDEHSIRAIGLVHKIEHGLLEEDHPVATSIIRDVESRWALYVAVLLHDIGKGRGGNHSEIGAEIATRLGPRLGLNQWETDTAEWLVRHHLLMSRIAFKRDIDDAKTVSDFVSIVQSPERLRLLLVLTVADIRAVGPGVWNAWKAGLLRELYYRAMEEMAGGATFEGRSARVGKAKNELRERLKDWTAEEIEAHLARGYDSYWLTFDTDVLVHHAKVVRDAERQGLSLHIETTVDKTRDVTELLIYTPDHPGLFARIAGVMSLCGASIVDAKIITLATGMALDTFSIQNEEGKAFANPERLSRLWRRIGEALEGKLKVAKELAAATASALPSRTKVFTVAPHVVVDNTASRHHTVIEVNGRDRPGFLYDVTAALTANGLSVANAIVTTYGERVVDVFYVKDVFGLKVEREDRLDRIRTSLLKVIGGEPASTRKAEADAEAAE